MRPLFECDRHLHGFLEVALDIKVAAHERLPEALRVAALEHRAQRAGMLQHHGRRPGRFVGPWRAIPKPD
jgi:hypothetical protein